MPQWTQSARQWLLRYLVLGLLIKAIMPLGFMPGSLFGGESFMTICPSQQSLLFQYAQESSNISMEHHQGHSMHLGHLSLVDSDLTTHHTSHLNHAETSFKDCPWGLAIFVFLVFTLVFLFQFFRLKKSFPSYAPVYFFSKAVRCLSIRAPPVPTLPTL